MADDKAVIARLGKLLFGRPLRLQLALWILEQQGGVFYQGEAVDAFPKADTNVIAELDRFVTLGMLKKLPKDWQPGQRRQNYQQEGSPLWAVIQRAASAIAALALRADGSIAFDTDGKARPEFQRVPAATNSQQEAKPVAGEQPA